MKKLILALLVVALAIPAMAADISLTDNGDGTGTIVLTVTGTEVVRGLAVVVDADVDITAVTGTDAIFNVFMDAAYDAELAVPGSYALGTGSPVANPAAVGGIALPAASISLCMGVLDESGFQGGAAVGSYNIGTITTGAATVTISADTLRGGIVGDAIVAGTIAGGLITDGPAYCVGAADEAEFVLLGEPASWCAATQCYGDATGSQEAFGKGFVWVGAEDLTILLAGWKATYTVGDAWIAADFSRTEEAFGKGFVRVGAVDLGILLANWKNDAGVGTDCNN